MKLTAIILLFFMVSLHAEGLAQRVTISEQNVSLETVFAKIRLQTGYTFIYTRSDLKKASLVTVNAKQVTVNEVMDLCLSGQMLTYTIFNNMVIVKERKKTETKKPTDELPPVVITGKVLDDKNQPLEGASVLEKGTNNAVVTIADGSFSLTVSKADAILEISFIGYERKEVKLTNTTSITINLEQTGANLNDVVVVGYSTQKKVNLTGAVSVLDMKKKENTPLTNVSQALHGVSGLWVNQAGSRPGADNASIRIRGVGTTNNSNPLVLVNGIEYDMNEINPNDIESVSVLKDASAAIYGSRAANGVVLITTKTGKSGKMKVNYNFSYGIQTPTLMPDVVWDPIRYMQLKNQALRNEGKTVVDYTDQQIEQYRQGMATNPYVYPNLDWFDLILDRGNLQQHHLQFSGGTDKITYSMGLGYMDQNGVLIANDNAQRYSLDLNLTAKVSKFLRVGGNIIANYRRLSEPTDGTSGFFGSFMRVLPIFTPYLEDGRYGNVVFRTPGRNAIENPMKLVKEGYLRPEVQRIFTKVFADVDLPFSIKYNINLGVDKLDNYTRQFNSRVNTYDPLTLAPMTYGQTVSSNTSNSNLNLTFFQTLNWDKKLADVHNISVMAGSSYTSFDIASFNASAENVGGNMLSALSASSLNPAVSGLVTKDRIVSYFGRVNYSFDEKYLLEAVFRYDGSSRFAEQNRWGFFPGLSAGWRIDKANFFHSNTVDLLKLRASVGRLGNQAVPLYSFQNTVQLGSDYSFGNTIQPGAAVTAYNDPEISWESTATYNAGIDFAAWGGKLTGEADVFKKRTSGILRQVNIPSQVGNLTGPQRNIGVVDNTGFELSLGHRNDLGQFTYEINGSVSYVNNKIIDLNGETVISGRRILKEGYPIDAYYVLQAEGIYQTQDEINKSAKVSSAVKPGYLKYKDINADGVINGNDRVVTGSSIPTWNYSFMINLGYKRFSLNAFFQGVHGINIYPTANLAYPVNNGAGLTEEWATESWTPDNRNARLPILSTPQGASENYQNSTFWFRSGNYMRLQNLQLNYVIPEALLSKVGISKFKLFVNLQNFFTFSDYKDSDPERNIQGDNLYTYPFLKTASAGVNVNF